MQEEEKEEEKEEEEERERERERERELKEGKQLLTKSTVFLQRFPTWHCSLLLTKLTRRELEGKEERK